MTGAAAVQGLSSSMSLWVTAELVSNCQRVGTWWASRPRAMSNCVEACPGMYAAAPHAQSSVGQQEQHRQGPNAGGILHNGHRPCAKPSTEGLLQVQYLCCTHSNEACRLTSKGV